MRNLIILTSLFLYSISFLYAQTSLTTDTILAKKFSDKAKEFYNNDFYDSSTIYYEKSVKIYRQNIHQLDEKVFWEKYLNCQFNIAANFTEQHKLPESKIILDSSIISSLKYLGDNHRITALLYTGFGALYRNLSEIDKALEYYQKALDINKKLYGEKSMAASKVIGSMAICYSILDMYDIALEYFFKNKEITENVFGKKNMRMANIYNNISVVYTNLAEYDKALEYLFMSLELGKELQGENNSSVASVYNNIGNVYDSKSESLKALEFYYKSLEIRKSIFGENSYAVAGLLDDIGLVYADLNQIDKALENQLKSLTIYMNLVGENNIDVAYLYNNLAATSNKKKDYDKALEYYFKSLRLKIQLLGKTSSSVNNTYQGIGSTYNRKSDFDKALFYLQKGITGCIANFSDTINLYSVPKIDKFTDWSSLLNLLKTKSTILADTTKQISFGKKLSTNERLLIALNHYKACDDLIIQARKKINKQSDKLALGETASKIYEEAIRVCLQLAKNVETHGHASLQSANEYRQQTFYFSEQNKSAVLQNSLSEKSSLQFAGIPDSLLKKERNLKNSIAFYEKKLAEQMDSTQTLSERNKLFTTNLQYENLIRQFEQNYPKYYTLKYSTKQPFLMDIQKKLEKKSAIRSYFVGDSTIYIFTVTQKKLDVFQISKIKNLDDSIENYRQSLTGNNKLKNANYSRIGNLLYQQLFPDSTSIDKTIENLVIVSDGSLGLIPFETLLTNHTNATKTALKDYPYLIQRFNVSYSYSVNLFYENLKKTNQKKPEQKNMNDWIAFAPVFSEEDEAGVLNSTRELQRQLSKQNTDSISKRGSLLNGDDVSDLPGTVEETQTIFNSFDFLHLKAQLLLHKKANEQFVKSGKLSNFRMIHFATHGFVDSEKPELSGILLAQDSTGGEDGILYSGEIYNLKLNADLVTLSACETGLGKIKKGEGIIGLSRALLFAGTKNLCVSLWQVSDKSTSDLMIDFYKNYLDSKKLPFSQALRKAKLKMIAEGKFAHPFYWSPFILIGK